MNGQIEIGKELRKLIEYLTAGIAYNVEITWKEAAGSVKEITLKIENVKK